MFFCKQKTAYEMRISDWSSDVCSSDLEEGDGAGRIAAGVAHPLGRLHLFALRPLELRKAVGPAGVGAVGGAGVDDPGPRIVDHGDRLARRLVGQAEDEIGRAHVCTPVTNAHLVCRLLLDKKNYSTHINHN